MSQIKPLILGMALIGALALLTGTFVTIPTTNALSPVYTGGIWAEETSEQQATEFGPSGEAEQHCIGCGGEVVQPELPNFK